VSQPSLAPDQNMNSIHIESRGFLSNFTTHLRSVLVLARPEDGLWIDGVPAVACCFPAFLGSLGACAAPCPFTETPTPIRHARPVTASGLTMAFGRAGSARGSAVQPRRATAAGLSGGCLRRVTVPCDPPGPGPPAEARAGQGVLVGSPSHPAGIAAARRRPGTWTAMQVRPADSAGRSGVGEDSESTGRKGLHRSGDVDCK
jgi:hypothetical protein